jgi:hypothetical protein
VARQPWSTRDATSSSTSTTPRGWAAGSTMGDAAARACGRSHRTHSTGDSRHSRRGFGSRATAAAGRRADRARMARRSDRWRRQHTPLSADTGADQVAQRMATRGVLHDRLPLVDCQQSHAPRRPAGRDRPSRRNPSMGRTAPPGATGSLRGSAPTHRPPSKKRDSAR